MNTPTGSIMPLPRHLPGAGRTGGDPGLDLFKFGEPAWNSDSSLVLVPILLLRFSKKLAKQGMVKIHDGYQNSVKVAIFLTHVDRQVSFRDSRVFVLDRFLTQRDITRPGFRETERFGSAR